MGIKEIWGAMELGVKGTIMIVSACAGIGMMIYQAINQRDTAIIAGGVSMSGCPMFRW